MVDEIHEKKTHLKHQLPLIKTRFLFKDFFFWEVISNEEIKKLSESYTIEFEKLVRDEAKLEELTNLFFFTLNLDKTEHFINLSNKLKRE